MENETRYSLAYLLGALAYTSIMYIPHNAAPTVAALVAGIIIAFIARSGLASLAIGMAVGLTGLLMTAGAWLVLGFSIVVAAGGGIVGIIVLVFHLLAPALLAAGFTVFFGRSTR